MAKIKMKRHGFRIDMTPMVDVGFLLLTFFMLTAKFKSQTDETVDIRLPLAQADTTKLPDVNIATITIGLKKYEDGSAPDTLIFFGVSNEKQREAIYEPLKLQLPNGAPLDNLINRAQVTVNKDQLDRAVLQARLTNPGMRYAIDADRNITYGYIDDVMRILQKHGATRFNLVTTIEG